MLQWYCLKIENSPLCLLWPLVTVLKHVRHTWLLIEGSDVHVHQYVSVYRGFLLAILTTPSLLPSDEDDNINLLLN